MVDGTNESAVKRLQQVIMATQGRKVAEVKYLGGNVATLLIKRDPLGLQALDLHNTIVRGADLVGAWLDRVNFAGADLSRSRFALLPLSSLYSVAFSPAGALLASGHENGEIWIWDVVTLREVVICKGHGSWVMSVAFSPDGSCLASGSNVSKRSSMAPAPA